MLTPLHPRIRKAFSIIQMIISLFLSTRCYAQNIKSESETQIISEIQNRYNKKYSDLFNAEMEELENDKKYTYLNFVPNVGYDLTRNAVVVGFNVNNIISYLKQRKSNRAKRKYVIAKYKSLLADDAIEISRSTYKIEKAQEDLRLSLEILDLENQRFAIDSLKYINHEIKISEYIDKRIVILQKRKNIYLKNKDIWDLNFEHDKITHTKNTIIREEDKRFEKLRSW